MATVEEILLFYRRRWEEHVRGCDECRPQASGLLITCIEGAIILNRYAHTLKKMPLKREKKKSFTIERAPALLRDDEPVRGRRR